MDWLPFLGLDNRSKKVDIEAAVVIRIDTIRYIVIETIIMSIISVYPSLTS